MGSETGTSKENETVKTLMTFITSEVEPLKLPETSPFIYRVSKEIRNGHAKFFEPISISIGPLHYDEKSPAQEFKKWYLKNFIVRLEQDGVEKIRLAEVMSGMEKHIRQYYRDIDPNLTGYKFAQIMLLDGCFILELLLGHKDTSGSNLVGNTEKVPFFTLQQDLLKIENQLPFEVLKYLANLIHSTMEKTVRYLTDTPMKGTERTGPKPSEGSSVGPTNEPLIDLALKFFNIPKPEKFQIRSPMHLLDLALKAKFYKNEELPDEASNSTTIQMGNEPAASSLLGAKSASELEFYGIKFLASPIKNNLMKIEFKNGLFLIPRLEVQESTAAIFWNFLIFEMSSSSSRIFTSYVVLMDTLINNEKDVEVLLQANILVTRNNDTRSLVSLFNDMSANVSQKDFYFEPLMQKVNRYCRSGLHPQRAYLVQNYYDARWDVLNNILLFIFTVTQTLFSILSYNPKGK